MTRTFTPDEIAACPSCAGLRLPRRLRKYSETIWVCADCGPKQHDSDCAVHNKPAYPSGQCDCHDDQIRASGPRPTGEPGANKPPSPEASGPVGRGFDDGGTP